MANYIHSAVVAGPGLDFHLCTVLPPLLSAMGDDDKVDYAHIIWRDTFSEFRHYVCIFM